MTAVYINSFVSVLCYVIALRMEIYTDGSPKVSLLTPLTI